MVRSELTCTGTRKDVDAPRTFPIPCCAAGWQHTHAVNCVHSLVRPAAVHHHGLPGDVAARVGGEVEQRAVELVLAAQPAHADRIDDVLRVRVLLALLREKDESRTARKPTACGQGRQGPEGARLRTGSSTLRVSPVPPSSFISSGMALDWWISDGK